MKQITDNTWNFPNAQDNKIMICLQAVNMKTLKRAENMKYYKSIAMLSFSCKASMLIDPLFIVCFTYSMLKWSDFCCLIALYG